MQDTVFNALAELALTASGQSIPPSKAYLIGVRLAAILRREGFAEPSDLVHCLETRQNPVLRAEIAAALASRETWFFRDMGGLEDLVRKVLPERLAAGPPGRVRIWCAGGSTGQEAYSLSMLLEEEAPFAGADIEILSTDLCRQSSEKGRSGLFGHYEVQRGLSVHRLLRHFTRLESGDWQASQALRNRVSFQVHNLLEPAGGLGEFDIILCRNVVSGMVRPARSRTAESLASQLAPGGMILLAEGETLLGLSERLEPASELGRGWVAAGTANARASAA